VDSPNSAKFQQIAETGLIAKFQQILPNSAKFQQQLAGLRSFLRVTDSRRIRGTEPEPPNIPATKSAQLCPSLRFLPKSVQVPAKSPSFTDSCGLVARGSRGCSILLFKSLTDGTLPVTFDSRPIYGFGGFTRRFLRGSRIHADFGGLRHSRGSTSRTRFGELRTSIRKPDTGQFASASERTRFLSFELKKQPEPEPDCWKNHARFAVSRSRNR
jgi:hypothetical protein